MLAITPPSGTFALGKLVQPARIAHKNIDSRYFISVPSEFNALRMGSELASLLRRP